jgi:hypothetical protein
MSQKRVDLDALGVDELLRRGIAAARVGEVDEATTFLTEVTVRDRANADAWLWLASLETNPQMKRDHFERVLVLRPDDVEARAGLDRLIEKYGQGVLQRAEADAVLHCTWHPERETLLRCSRCGRPMCPECARKHPVGWRCKECAKELRSPIYKVAPQQYALGLLVGVVASIGAAVLLGLVGGFWFVGILLAAPAGTFVADMASRGAGRKRGRGMQFVAAGAVLLGVVIVHWALALGPLRGLVPYSAFGSLIYGLLGTGAAFYRLR